MGGEAPHLKEGGHKAGPVVPLHESSLKSLRQIALLALLLALGLRASAQPAAGSTTIESVVAVVDGRPLLLSDQRALEQVRGLPPPAALEALVDERLMQVEASRLPQAEVLPEEEEQATLELLARRPALLPVVPASDLRRLVRRQLAILKYVEFRFRPQLRVSDEDILAYPQERARSLLRVSEAPVPLAGHERSRFVLFRETVADLEHVAIIIGEPDPSQPVLVRLHSSCLTGDLFASLRCDCGDQLRGAIDRLGEGGGVLLYLAQEGRGIGLANKLRAYDRQDAGLDTIDADRYLGFRGDERNFAVAVQMLHELGIGRIRLLTNNPAKIAALRQAGIDVVERIGIGAPVNRHNERYITTKRDRAGHLIEVANLPAQRQAS